MAEQFTAPQDEMMDLKKLLAKRENEWKKDRALLEQKINLLQIQIEDCKTREDNLRKMNQIIQETINDGQQNGQQNSILKEIKNNIEQHQNDLISQKSRNQDLIRNLELENRMLKDSYSEAQMKFAEEKIALEEEKRELAKQLDKSQRTIETLRQNDEKGKSGDIQEELKKQRAEHNKEVAHLKEKFDKEKEIYESRLQKNQHTLKKYQVRLIYNHFIKSEILSVKQQINLQKKAHLEKEGEVQQKQTEINQLKKEMEEQQQAHAIEINNLIRERDQLQQKVKHLENSNTTQNISHYEDRSFSNVSRSYQRIPVDESITQRTYQDIKNSIRSLEISKYQLRENANAQHRQQSQQLIQESRTQRNERDRSVNYSNNAASTANLSQIGLSEQPSQSRLTKSSSKSSHFNNDCSDRSFTRKQRSDASTNKLYQQEEMQDLNQSKITSRKPQPSQHSYYEEDPVNIQLLSELHQEKENINNKNTDCMPLQMTDKRGAVAGTRSQKLYSCESCNECFSSNEYQTHVPACRLQQNAVPQADSPEMLSYQNSANTSVVMTRQQQQQQQPQQQQLQNKGQTSKDSSFFKIIGELNHEKVIIEQKLQQLENRLMNSECYNHQLNQDRDRLRQQLEYVLAELQKAQTHTQINNEEQEACTTALKNEIKYLINKLLRAKGKLADNSSTQNISSSAANLDTSLNVSRKDYSQFSIKNSVNYRSAQDLVPGSLNKSKNFCSKLDDLDDY